MRNLTPVFKKWMAAAAFALIALMTAGCGDRLIVLDPKGPVGEQQRDLIYISTALCLIVIVPVLVMTAVIVWRYRERAGSKAKYKPDWEHNGKLEAVWWGIPIVIIIILGTITVKYTHALEPSKPLESEVKPVTIQVTSLDWKWLFYYPDQGIATVNYVQFPEDTPIKFLLTSDAPMNSFWIPQLGGQIYTMSGMAMTLHLQADEPGEYMGSGANFSGREFAKMRFTAKATSQQEFDAWVADIKKKEPALTEQTYEELAKPGVSDVRAFSSFPVDLFDRTVKKYGAPHSNHNAGALSGAEHGEHDRTETGGKTAPVGKQPAEPSKGMTKQERGSSHVGEH